MSSINSNSEPDWIMFNQGSCYLGVTPDSMLPDTTSLLTNITISVEIDIHQAKIRYSASDPTDLIPLSTPVVPFIEDVVDGEEENIKASQSIFSRLVYQYIRLTFRGRPFSTLSAADKILYSNLGANTRASTALGNVTAFHIHNHYSLECALEYTATVTYFLTRVMELRRMAVDDIKKTRKHLARGSSSVPEPVYGSVEDNVVEYL